MRNEDIEKAFQIVQADASFRFGGSNRTIEAKLFIVEIYEKLTGKKVLPDSTS